MYRLSIISVFIGCLSLLLLASMRVFPSRWSRIAADAGRDVGRPSWSWMVIALSPVIALIAWYYHFTEGGPYSLIEAILITVIMIRMAQVLWTKEGLRTSAETVPADRAWPYFYSYLMGASALIVLGVL